MTYESFINTLRELPHIREQFARFMGPDGTKAFADLPLFGQVGFIIRFLERLNLGVCAYIDRYDIFYIDNDLVSPEAKHGMITLEILHDFGDTLYHHYGIMERGEKTSVYHNLITSLIEALKLAETYGIEINT